jgi:hypothetical protein
MGQRAAETGKFPPEYLLVIEAIRHAYCAYREAYPDREPPRFALPPREFMVIVSLEIIAPRVARNDTAACFLEGLIQGAKESGDSKNMPTLFMLGVALDSVGAEIERVSLAELGLSPTGRDN